MKRRFLFNVGQLFLLGGRLLAAPAVGNDGTTTDNLSRLSNLYGTADATVSLEPRNGILAGAQSSVVADIPVRTVWFLNTHAPTSGVYGVSVEFKPASEEGVDSAVHHGGVMGWLDMSTKVGIALQVVPAAVGGYFQLTTVNFLASDESSNEGFANLYNLDGTAALADSTSALSGLGDYTPLDFATFHLDFALPSPADLAAVSNATARITAKVFQGEAGSLPVQLGRTIELLTDLPAPSAGRHEHRVGYFGYWGSLFREGSIIGEFDNLLLLGGFGPVTNHPPEVRITEPATGTAVIGPANLTISVEAIDIDGLVEQVVFLDGIASLATSRALPFRYDWIAEGVGAHVLTAVAIDDRGAATTSPPVTVTVLAPYNAPPEVILVGPTDGQVFTAPAEITFLAEASDTDGEVSQVEFYANGSLIGMATSAPFSLVWTNVVAGTYALVAKAIDALGASAISTNQVTVSVKGQPGEQPVLSIALVSPDTGAVQLSWPIRFTGYELQWTQDLLRPVWTGTTLSTNNIVVFTISGAQTFFRLVKQ
jgi:hypothetical protein